MHHIIKSGNAYGCLKVDLRRGEFISVRQNSLVAFSDHITFTASKPSGFFRKLAKKFSGNHMDMQQIDATQNGWVMLAPPMIGALSAIDTHGQNILVEQDAFLATGNGVTTNGKIHPLEQNQFSRADFSALRFLGDGQIFLNAFGAIEMITLLPEQEIRVHPDYLIGWEELLIFSRLDRGFIKIMGPGRIWLQTRSNEVFETWQDNLKQQRKSANS